jgi:hypothetical protein
MHVMDGAESCAMLRFTIGFRAEIDLKAETDKRRDDCILKVFDVN